MTDAADLDTPSPPPLRRCRGRRLARTGPDGRRINRAVWLSGAVTATVPVASRLPCGRGWADLPSLRSRSFAAIGSGPPTPGRRCWPCWRGPRPGGRIHLPSRVRPGQRRCARPGSRCLAAHQGGAGLRAAGDRDRRQDRPRREEQGREGPAPGRGPGARHRRCPGQVAVDEKSNEIPRCGSC